MHYRSDIDGLRAIAVLFVLFYHGGVTFFSSGFIGVDIFFVISGFLITSIIVSSLENNNLSLSDFYVRRLWRLQPALIAVVIFTLAIAVVFYLPADFISYAKEAKYTSLFMSNQYFARATTAYAAPDTEFILLLHTWSLSIEWQWYLVLPAAIILLSKYIAKQYMRMVVAILALSMLALSMYLSQLFPDKSYYFLTSRVFEFLFGSSLVFFKSENIKCEGYKASLPSFIAIVAILYCATRTDIVTGYPDYHAVIVAAAAATIIFIGSSGNGVATRLLSFKPLVFIGTISYSLYLWHWPVFATGRYLGFAENVTFTTVCFILTFVLAWLSYCFVEKPLRKIRTTLLKSLVILVLIPVLFFLVLLPTVERHDGLAWRFGSDYKNIVLKLKEHESINRKYCIDINDDNQSKDRCIIGDVNSSSKSLLIGDSFSNHYWGFIDVIAKDAHMSVLVQGTSSCLTLPGIYQFDWWYFKNSVYQKCHDDSEKYFKKIREGHFDFVIIGEVWNNYGGNNIINAVGDQRSIELSRKRIEASMRKAFDIVIRSGARPAVIKQTYTMPDDFMHCFYDGMKLRKDYVHNRCNSSSWQGDSDDWFAQLFVSLKKDYPELIVIDPKDAQCSGTVCKTDIDGVPVYRDVGHITDYASYAFGKEYLIKSHNPFK